jgi:hypothetical protein
VFQNTDGSVVLETTTDATGLASATMAYGNVTVARTFPAPVGSAAQRPAEIYTYVGAAAGDHLVLGDPTDDTGLSATVNVMVPADANGTVNVTSACGAGQGAGPVVQVTVAGCTPSVLFFVEDADQDSFVASAPYSGNIDLTTGELLGTLGTSFTATDLTPDIATVDVDVYAMDGTHELYNSGNQQIATGSGADPAPVNVNLPNLRGVNVEELVVTTIDSSDGTQMISSRAAYAPTPQMIDASANLLPYVSAAVYSPTSVSWREDGTGTADFVVSTLAVTPAAGAKFTRYIIAPHTGMTLAVPALAGGEGQYNAGATDTVVGTLGIATTPGGYASARQLAFSTPNLANATPMSGSTTLSYAGATAPML